METLTYEEIRQKLAKAYSLTNKDLVHDIQQFVKYSQNKKPVIMNADYYTIDYDNVVENHNFINNLPVTDDKSLFHYVNYIIQQNQSFYYHQFGSMTKATWIKKIISKNEISVAKKKMSMHGSIFLLKDVYTTYYMLKLTRCCLANMRRGVNIIYSKETKNKTILNHPNYHKGKNYFLSAIEAQEEMINDIFFVCKNLIKTNFGELLGYNIATFETKEDNIKKIKNIYDSIIIESSSNIQYLETTPEENYKQLFKVNNINLYKHILNLSPCNFLKTFMYLNEYICKWKFNIYLYNIINKIENPEYYRFNMTIDIE